MKSHSSLTVSPATSLHSKDSEVCLASGGAVLELTAVAASVPDEDTASMQHDVSALTVLYAGLAPGPLLFFPVSLFWDENIYSVYVLPLFPGSM